MLELYKGITVSNPTTLTESQFRTDIGEMEVMQTLREPNGIWVEKFNRAPLDC